MFTKLLGWLKKMDRAEELAEKYPTEILELALEIKQDMDKEVAKSDKVDLSKIPTDVLERAIKLKEKEAKNGN